ncbi:MAG TPA: glycosyltransferase family 4 protein [Gemmatimonadota bacterium]|nr:glycosyltransferase family 4 protein [Gemmatimonadota bacterium]
MRAIRVTRPDLVVGVNAPDAYGGVARLRRRGSPVRVAMAIHGIEPGLYGDARRFRGVLDGVIASNRLACRLAEDIGGIDSARVHYAPYGLEAPADLPPARTPGAVLRIGFVSRIVEAQKRVDDLAKISRALDRASVSHQLVIAGSGPYEARLRESLNGDQAVFLGSVAASDLPESVYRRIDALLITSDWETGPLVAWEAMAEGVPVVSSRYVGSGLESSLRNEENALLFEVGDAEAAAGHLARLRTEPGLRDRIRRGGLQLVRERYSRRLSVETWERSFEAVMEAPPLPDVPEPPVPRATGRLERVMGAGVAESVREALRRTGPDSSTAGEWPHAYGSLMNETEFMRQATRIDRDGRVV